MKHFAFAAAILVLFLLTAAKTYKTGESYVRIIHRAHAGKWFKTLTFEQNTKFYQNGVLSGEQTWYEAGIYPNMFRIDFGSPDSGNTYISRNDTAFLFRKGKLMRTMPEVNELLFLYGGMYFLPEDTVISQLRNMGFDLSKTHNKKYNNRRIYVVGAAAGDTVSPQIWFDAEHHYVVRILRKRNGHNEDIRSGKHIRLGGAWCETEVIFYMDGKLVQEEFYSNCKANEPLDPRIFDPKALRTAHWLKK
ncbi:MAG: hypothetical protein ACRC3B_09515 [Bacteroidia bacterium]